ncbi:MAG: PLP-dependent aminotransferase family protein [Proteobacteria bacterium]|nr:PLP-dependent aminotransferase family protein [Pseudomonadota bacterium]
MTIWIPTLAARSGPKHRVITDAIGDAIADGSLAPEAKLPPQRELAYALGLSLGTVTRAYKDAERRGFVTGEVGRGTYVRRKGSARAATSLWGPVRDSDAPINFVMNLPPVGIAAPVLAESFARLGASRELGHLLDHQASGRIETHMRAAANWVARLGLEATGDEIVLTNGAQHGILAALMATANPGDIVLAETLTYPPLKQIAHHLHLRLHAVEMDGHGIVPEALDAACRGTVSKVLYCMPTLHSPTGISMPEERRRDIAQIARDRGLTIIEDDVFGFLPENRPSPLAVSAPERTIFVTSVSKCLAPGLRIGIVRTPEIHREAVRNAVRMSCWMPSPITAEIACQWIEDGTADRLNDWLRAEMHARCQLACDILGNAVACPPFLSFHLWIELAPPWREESFRIAAEQRNVKVASGEIFALRPKSAPQAVRLALGYEADRARMAEGLRIVADLLGGGGASGASIV